MAVPLGGRGSAPHRPVLLQETIELLAAARGGLFVDCTVGLGGHSEAILQASRDATVLGIDRDDEALKLARERLAQYGSRSRGFSFRHDAPLDMRMDAAGGGETAGELLGRLSEVDIARIIFEYGEERRSRRIARFIVEGRERGEPVRSTRDLAQLVERAVGPGKKRRIHPATRTFQALRIAVNQELENLDRF